MQPVRNITLVGMPASGKSTLGTALATRLGWAFVDLDVVISQGEGRHYSEVLTEVGPDRFLDLEADYAARLNVDRSVIAPGGSVVYRDRAMEHLRTISRVVHLHVPLEVLKRRVGDLVARGVVLGPGMTFADLYAQRTPLFARWAHETVVNEEEERTVERLVEIAMSLA